MSLETSPFFPIQNDKVLLRFLKTHERNFEIEYALQLKVPFSIEAPFTVSFFRFLRLFIKRFFPPTVIFSILLIYLYTFLYPKHWFVSHRTLEKVPQTS